MAKNKDHPGNNEVTKPTWPANYIRRVVVKFRDTKESSEIPYDERVEKYPERYLGRNWSQLLEQFPGITIQRLITSVTPQHIRELVKRANKKRGDQISASSRPIRRGRKRDKHDEPPNFLTYFSVPCPAGVEPQAVAEALRKWRWPEQTGRYSEDQPGAATRQRGIEVELAYVESGPAPPPGIILSAEEDPQLDRKQAYLTPAPVGIDAEYAWTIEGGDGDTGVGAVGLQFVDIEQGWTIDAQDLNPVLTNDHEDLPAGIQCIWGVPRKYFGHGTGVLGIVLAVPGNADGTVGASTPGSKNCVGITPNVQNRMVASIWADISGASIERVNAIMYVIDRLNPGDVLLLEDQIWAYGSLVGQTNKNWYRCPLEVEDALNDAIWLATNNDLVVIEAAGNGGIDLDDFTPDGNFWDWVNSITYSSGVNYWNTRDSGAIMVAAADSQSHDPDLVSSNRGRRIDCFAWGDGISTTGNPDPNRANTPGPQDYTVGFSGTSGASAIIAGAALAIQGIAQVNLKGNLSNKRFSPSQLRSILSDWETGTLSVNSDSQNGPQNWNADKIGVMPDLRNIIINKLEIAPPLLKKVKIPKRIRPKRFRVPAPRIQALHKKPAKAKRKSPK